MAPREVRRSAAFLAQANALFPPGGSAEGAPDFEAFERGPLRGAERAFSLAFEAQREAVPGVGGLRFVAVAPTPVFGPVLVWGVLTTDDAVELVGISHDPDYWNLVGDDPAD